MLQISFNVRIHVVYKPVLIVNCNLQGDETWIKEIERVSLTTTTTNKTILMITYMVRMLFRKGNQISN